MSGILRESLKHSPPPFLDIYLFTRSICVGICILFRPQRQPLFALAHADVLHIPLEPSATLAYLSAPLAATLEPQALSPGTNICTHNVYCKQISILFCLFLKYAADARALSKDVDALTRDALGDDISALVIDYSLFFLFVFN